MRPLTPLLTICLCLLTANGRAEEQKDDKQTAKYDSRGRSAAVALNYCRASFHRIKRNGTKPVLLEEQEKILNNLNLNGIADQEVVTLYTKVLEEIGGETIAEVERKHLKSRFRRNLGRQAMASALLMSAQATSLQFGQAMLTGANSWWDYRNIKQTKDTAVWNIEKTRMTKVVNSSSNFLDTFWKMIQKKNIPDRWLIRSADLDNLDAAMAESDPQVRLRLLTRLEKFMEAYPPYWYHVARTQQALGQWKEAAATYQKLADDGAGHFRRDEMLAAGLANLAAIQDYLGDKDAPRTAQEALSYADSVWQANLLCANILVKHGEYEDAEEAVLRNIDAKLELSQSLIALMSIHQASGNRQKLGELLRNETTLAQMPIPAVLRACSFLGSSGVPTNVNRHLLQTFFGYADLNFGMDDVVLMAAPVWKIETAQVQLTLNGRQVPPPQISPTGEWTRIRFANVSQLGGLFVATPRNVSGSLSLRYPHMKPIVLKLNRVSGSETAKIWEQDGGRRPGELSRRSGGFLVSDIDFGDRKLTLIEWGRSGKPAGTVAKSGNKTFPNAPKTSKTFPSSTAAQPVSQTTDPKSKTPSKPTIEIETVTPLPETEEPPQTP